MSSGGCMFEWANPLLLCVCLNRGMRKNEKEEDVKEGDEHEPRERRCFQCGDMGHHLGEAGVCRICYIQLRWWLNSPVPRGHHRRRHSNHPPSSVVQYVRQRSKEQVDIGLFPKAFTKTEWVLLVSATSTLTGYNRMDLLQGLAEGKWTVPLGEQGWQGAVSAAGSRAPWGCMHRTTDFLWTRHLCHSALQTPSWCIPGTAREGLEPRR